MEVCFIVASVAFWVLWSSADSFFLWQVLFAGEVGHLVVMRGGARLSTATVETSVDAGLFEPIQLSLEVVDLAVLFMLNICDHSRLRTNAMECQLPKPYIEANMQVSGEKAMKGLHLPSLKDICGQGRAHPSP